MNRFKGCGATITCIDQQVAEYLDDIVYPTPTGGLQRSFSSLSADQLATLLDAVYGSSAEASVLEAVRYAIMRSDLLTSDKLGVHLLNLAILHKRSAANFSTNASNYRTIALFGESYSDEALAYMATNPETMVDAIGAKAAKPWITYSGLFQILAEDPESTVASVTEDWIDWGAADSPAQVTPSSTKTKWTQVLDRDFTTPVIGQFDRRHGEIEYDPVTGEITSPEDLTRHKGDGPLIDGVEAPDRSEARLWYDMASLLEIHSYGDLDNVTEAFLEQFRSNKGGKYTSRTLSKAVSETPEFKNMVNYIGDLLNQQILDNNLSVEGIGVVA